MKFGLLLPLALIACSGPAVQQGTVRPSGMGDDAAATITAADIHTRIAFLASDALRGRDTPSPGLDTAAAYIAREYRRLGLEPHGDSGSYIQRYPYGRRTLRAEGTALSATAGGQTTTYAFGSEMFAQGGAPEQWSGDVVFAGSKIDSTTAPMLRGKAVFVFVPGAMDRAWRASVTSARNSARMAGASGLVILLDPSISADAIRQRAALSLTTSAVTVPAPVVYLRYDRARELFARAGRDLDALRSNTGAQAVTLANTRAQANVPVATLTQYPPNVVAVLRGSDPVLKNTYVVLSAHMDHIGVGRPNAQGDSINNGADDDASGTSAVLEAAEAFAGGKRPLRSILFLNVSGEEKGLLGSQYFTDHPTVPLTSIVADINIDMIGRNNPDTVVAIGQDYSSLGPRAQQVVREHPELHLTASQDIWPQERFFFRSDHFNFAKHDVPAIFFFTGVHPDYHQPSDEVEKIDTDKAARIAKLVYYLASEIANNREPPRWTGQGLRDVRALTR